MNSKEKTKKHFNKIASKYNESYDGKFVSSMYSEIYSAVIANCKVGTNILDLGCGTGNVIAMLLPHKEINIAGVDLCEKMIDEAKKRFEGESVELKVGDVENLPFEDNSFDMIICNASFHHYTKPLKAMSEIRRILKPGGHLIIGDPTNQRLFLPFVNFSLKFIKEGDYHMYSQSEIGKLIEEYGFRIKNSKLITRKSFMICAKLS